MKVKPRSTKKTQGSYGVQKVVRENEISTKHLHEIPKLRRVRGQVEGIERMVQDGRYCVDILNQLKAAHKALRAIEKSVMQTHLRGCLKKAADAKDALALEEKIEEIVSLIS